MQKEIVIIKMKKMIAYNLLSKVMEIKFLTNAEKKINSDINKNI